MLGIVPAAGAATRLQPWTGSKELLPLGQAVDHNGASARLIPISEYVLDRMAAAGADRICLVISGGKSDLLAYYAQSEFAARLVFMVQPRPLGLCDAVFRAAPLARQDEMVLIGLPDTVWYPRHALTATPTKQVHLVTFPVPNPHEFDAVIPEAAGDEADTVARVEVKRAGAPTRRIWGAITAPSQALLGLRRLWLARGAQDQYLGALLNAWIQAGERVSFDCNGTHYWDVGTPASYDRALRERAWEQADAALVR